MKTAIALLFVGLFQLSLTMPMEDPPCEAAFSAAVCDGWNKLEDTRVKRQLPGKDVLERLLTEKLRFLTGFGLLKGIPVVGQFVHDLVERDPEGVAKAVSGGIFAVIPFVMGAMG